MRKQILTDNETKTFLMKTFKCSRQAVWQALNFVRDSGRKRRAEGTDPASGYEE